MIKKEIIVKNVVGIHSRPATAFIQTAMKYNSAIWVDKGNRRVDAKSLLGVLSLDVNGNDNITIGADGDDENEALADLIELVESGFERK